MTVTGLYPFAVDANVVLGLVTSAAGRGFLATPLLDLSMPTYTFDEFTEHLERPLQRKVTRGLATQPEADVQYAGAMSFVTGRIRRVPPEDYAAYGAEARDRVPGDPDDWHTVALARAGDAEIWTNDRWTNDRHFLGCGVPTWTNETLRRRLAAGRLPPHSHHGKAQR